MSECVKNCRGRLTPSNAVIMYPALTSPALVPVGEHLDIIIAGDKQLLQEFLNEKPGAAPGSEVGAEFLRHCHSHLVLTPWRDLYGEPTAKDPALPGVRFKKGKQRLADLEDLAGCKNMIYNTEQHEGPVIGSQAGQCTGWYLGELENHGGSFDFTVSMQGDAAKPLGILGKAAASMYFRHNYRSLFHLRFSDIPNRANGVHELLWLSCEYGQDNPERPLHYIPAEDLILPLFTREITRGGYKTAKAKQPQTLLKPAALPGPEEPPRPPLEGKRCLNSYALFDLGRALITPEQKRCEGKDAGKKLDSLPCMKQTGHLFTPRHPVYFSNKPLLDIGVIADPHISVRQALYKLTRARVIPGVDEKVDEVEEGVASGLIVSPKPDDSPLIGSLAHENLQTTRELFEKTARQCDVIFFAGDMYDHIRNCHPAAYRAAAGDEEACRSGTLWQYMDYDAHKEGYGLYPRYPDAMLGLELIYRAYAADTPVIFTAGNHEAYEDAYGISPRILFGSIKGNSGIPLDHNLTFYEAVLLYGPAYDKCTKGRLDDATIGIFREENFAWLHQFLSPWKDVCISYGDRQNILCLDWGTGEKYLANVVLGDTLPVAKNALTDDQYLLFKRRMTKGPVNILATHFTHAAYTHSVPLFYDRFASQKWNGLPDLNARERPPVEHEAKGDGEQFDIGTFTGCRPKVWEAITALPIPYLISGHTHRAGLYEIRSPGRYMRGMWVPDLEKMERIALTKRKEPTRTAVLVSGSCGTYNKQNIWGELGNIGMDRPQSMVLRLEKGRESVEIIRSAAPAPRVAVVMDYLWESGRPLFAPSSPMSGSLPVPDWSPLPHVSYHITCLGPSEQYTYTLHPKLCRYFSWLYKSITYPVYPINEIKLHAVNPSNGKHGGCLLMRAEREPRGSTVGLTATGKDVVYFVEKHIRNEAKIKDPLFFCSVHFADLKEVPLPGEYDCTSPWCFPVAVDKIGPCYQIKRGWTGDTKTGDEIPDFKKLRKIEEYKA